MLYPKDPKKPDRQVVAATVCNYVLGLAACLLLVFQLCYTMLLCMEIPVSFTDGEYMNFFLMELGLVAALAAKLVLNLRTRTLLRHGIFTSVFSLIAMLIWILFLVGDLTDLASPLESAFRGKVLVMDFVGVATAAGGLACQLAVLLRGRLRKAPDRKEGRMDP